MRRRGERQKGFAMLLVFVMAATVAIMLYKELPRVAFEAQRNKEQLLIERGEQYSRAIQLYVRKWKKYPAKIEDLESTNQIRYLRKRYDDPMTGKSEWRLVHVGPGGVFLDSLVHKPPSLEKDEKKAANTFTYEAPATGSMVVPGQAVPGFTPVRPSERAGLRMPGQQPGQPVDPNNPQAQQNQQQPGLYNPNQPYPFPPGVPGGQAGVNPQAYPGQPQTGVNPLQPFPQQAYPQQPYPQQGAYPGQPVNSQTGGVSPYPTPYSTQPGAQGAPPPFGQPGSTTIPGGQPGQNPALALINQILTTPRAGGQAATSQPMAGMQIGGGIAGVASTVERTGIKIYNEKEKYNEWEFLYDLTQDKTGMGAAIGAGIPQQVQGQQQGQQGLQNQQQNPTQSPFGQPGFGAQPGSNSIFGPQQPVRPR